jgi:cytoskeletal protein RodZ
MNWVIRPTGDDSLVKKQETLGEFLKRERELKKVSLRELAKKTKVREHFLKAIEEDKLEVLPSPVYIKGFLSAYAKSIGLDPHDVLLRYERPLKGEPNIAPEVKPEEKPERRPERKPEKKPEAKPEEKPERKPIKKFIWSRKQIWIVSGVIAISFLISYFFHPYLSGPPVEPPSNMQQARETLPIIANTQTQEVSLTVEEKPLSLEIKAIEETWVQIQIDDQPKAEVLFKPGEGNSYQATHRIELLIGNGGGIDLVFNGKKLERFGGRGEVITLIVTHQGVEKKRPEERKSP